MALKAWLRICTVLPKYNVVLARTSLFAHDYDNRQVKGHGTHFAREYS